MTSETPEVPGSDEPMPAEERVVPQGATVSGAAAARHRTERFRKSREYRHALTTLIVLGIFAATFLLTAVVSSLVLVKDSQSFDFDRRWWLLPGFSLAIGLLLLLVAWVRWSIAYREWEDRLDDEEKEELRRKLEEQLPETDRKLQRLINANRALLNKYQEPVRAQARTSYTYAQAAITVGLLLLVVGAAVTLRASDTATQVGIAALTAVGTALSGYIARTYLRVYEHAQQQLNFYFREPLVTSYLLTAERFARELEGDRRQEAYSEMVSELVRGIADDVAMPRASAMKSPSVRRKSRADSSDSTSH